VDATRKLPSEGYQRGWPADAVMSPDIVAKVTRRWKEYGL
jgi:4-hydroxy-3-polyprenylbenzoate decarboxylase